MMPVFFGVTAATAEGVIFQNILVQHIRLCVEPVLEGSYRILRVELDGF